MIQTSLEYDNDYTMIYLEQLKGKNLQNFHFLWKLSNFHKIFFFDG